MSTTNFITFEAKIFMQNYLELTYLTCWTQQIPDTDGSEISSVFLWILQGTVGTACTLPH